MHMRTLDVHHREERRQAEQSAGREEEEEQEEWRATSGRVAAATHRTGEPANARPPATERGAAERARPQSTTEARQG